MHVDQTAVGIALGILGAASYVVVRLHRQQAFELGATVLVFLGLFALPGGVGLIRAGLLGDVAQLPSIWREEVAISGIVTIGLSGHFLFGAFRAAFAHIVASEPRSGGSEQTDSA